MTNRKMIQKLKTAQALLSDVYHYACDEGLQDIESQMSCADSCIIETLEMAIEYANHVYCKTGIILGIEELK